MNKASRVHISGPLARYGPEFREELEAQGYTDSSAASQLHLMAHLSRWMTEQDLDAGGLTCAHVERFVDARRSEGRSVHRSQRSLAGLLGFLRRLGVVPPAASSTPCTPAGRVLERYRIYLVQERGLAATTVGDYTDIAGRFVAGRACDRPGLESVSVAEVREFVTSVCVGRSPGAARNVVSAVRSWLGFLHLEGVISRPLAQTVPAGPVRAGSGLPRAVGPEVVAAVLQSCDRDTGQGRRSIPPSIVATVMVLGRLHGLSDVEVITDTAAGPADADDGQITERLTRDLDADDTTNADDSDTRDEDVVDKPNSNQNNEDDQDDPKVDGEAAYGGGDELAGLNERGIDAMVKTQPPSSRGGLFSKDAFDIDLDDDTATCPDGNTVPILRGRTTAARPASPNTAATVRCGSIAPHPSVAEP